MVLLAVLAAACVLPGAAQAHPVAAPAGPADVPPGIERALGDDVRALGKGLYKVNPRRGPDILTHGPDVKRGIAPSAEAASISTGFDLGDPERAPVCATDYYQHILYAHPSSSNRYETVKASIQAAIRRTNAVLNDESLASGGRTADYKVLCDETGEIEVGSFATSRGDFGSIVTAARAAGFDEPNADYTIFYDNSLNGYCGVGSFAPDSSLRADNLNNRGGSYGVSYRGCWFDETPMHENGHNQGAVQDNAPFASGEAHCWDEEDVMCYDDDGGLIPVAGLRYRCISWNHFDCGYDSYFDTAPEAGEYLATHWNLGSPLNRFIQLGPPANSAPNASFAMSCFGLTCTFSDQSSDSDGSVTTRSWSFSDGAGDTASPAVHAFPAAGSYTARLTVTDDDGAVGTTTRSVLVADPAALIPEVASLSNGVSVRSQSAEADGWRYFRLRVPSGRRRVVFKVNGLDCTATDCPAQLDLYVRRGSRPTLGSKRCAPTSSDADERCRILRPRAGTWYAGVRTADGVAHVPFTATGRHRS